MVDAIAMNAVALDAFVKVSPQALVTSLELSLTLSRAMMRYASPQCLGQLLAATKS